MARVLERPSRFLFGLFMTLAIRTPLGEDGQWQEWARSYDQD
jgi:hypothetical protein